MCFIMNTVDKGKLINAMKDYFGDNEKRIKHALRVLANAEKILNRENGNPEVVIPSAIFHDIGIHEAERKYRSNAGKYQEIERPPVAKKILEVFGIDGKIIDEVVEIIAHHHSPGKINTLNFKLLHDVDWLVNLPDEYNVSDRGKIERAIEKLFLTGRGREISRAKFLR